MIKELGLRLDVCDRARAFHSAACHLDSADPEFIACFAELTKAVEALDAYENPPAQECVQENAKLPRQVPFNDPVNVCLACRRAGCLVDRALSCDDRNTKSPEHAAFPLASVRTWALESPGVWKGHPNRDQLVPIDLVDLHELVREQRRRAVARQACDRWGRARFAYSLHRLGLDVEQVSEAMDAEWPEESES